MAKCPPTPGPPDLSAAVRTITRFTFRPLLGRARPQGLQLRVVRAAIDAAGRLAGGVPQAAHHPVAGPVSGEWVLPSADIPGPPRGVLVFLHGGGYVAGSPRAVRSVAASLAQRTRMPVFVPAYRRAPEHRFPVALNDCLTVLRHLWACGVPPGRIVVAGDSAGAHLAVAVTTALLTRQEPPPAALSLFSPLLDPFCTSALEADTRSPDPMFPPVFALRCGQAFTDDPDPDDPRHNVLVSGDDVLAGFPPVLSQSGGTECVAADARQLHERLTGLGVRSVHRVAPGQVHGFVGLHRILVPAREALHAAADFLVQVLDDAETAPPLTLDAVHRATGTDENPEAADVTWHPLSSTGDSFLDEAPLRVRREIDINAAPDAVWAILSADDAVVSWSDGVTAARWSSGTARGVGSVREVTLAGLITVRERFHRWDAPFRQTFTVTEASRPGIRRFAEDYRITKTAHGSRLTWTIAIEPSRFPRLVGLLARPVLTWSITSMLRAIRHRSQSEDHESGAPTPEP